MAYVNQHFRMIVLKLYYDENSSTWDHETGVEKLKHFREAEANLVWLKYLDEQQICPMTAERHISEHDGFQRDELVIQRVVAQSMSTFPNVRHGRHTRNTVSEVKRVGRGCRCKTRRRNRWGSPSQKVTG